MKISRVILLPVMMVALASTLSACGKKDEKFKQRRTESALGARAALLADQEAGEIADSQNLRVDFIDMKAPVAHAGQGIYVQSTLTVNDSQQHLTTNHFNPNLGQNTHQQGTTQIGGQDVHVIAYCRDQACRQYYILATISQGTQARLQIGLKYDFDNTVNRWYTIRLPERFYRTHSEFVEFMDNAQNFMDY